MHYCRLRNHDALRNTGKNSTVKKLVQKAKGKSLLIFSVGRIFFLRCLSYIWHQLDENKEGRKWTLLKWRVQEISRAFFIWKLSTTLQLSLVVHQRRSNIKFLSPNSIFNVSNYYDVIISLCKYTSYNFSNSFL